MKFLSRAIVIVALSMSAQTAQAKWQCIDEERKYVVSGGFLDGHQLQELTDQALGFYTMGFVSAVSLSDLLGGSASCRDAISRCTANRNGAQYVAIMRKFLKDNPEKWHLRANMLIFDAVLRPCMYG